MSKAFAELSPTGDKIEAITPDVPVKCYFCHKKITVFGRGKGAGHHVIHHLNGDRRHNYTANLVDAHKGCHNRYHVEVGEGWTPEMRERQSELMATKMLGNTNKTGKTGAVMSPETRERMSEAQRLRRRKEREKSDR